MTHMRYLHGCRAEAATGGVAGDPLHFTLVREGLQADGLDLRMKDVELDRFLANPVVGYGHSFFGRDSLPIGRAENVQVVDDRLEADAIFDPADPFAAEVDRKYRDGFLRAVSIGFRAWGVDEETGIPQRWELIEFSAVPIGLDPDALIDDDRLASAAMTLAGGRSGSVDVDMARRVAAAIERTASGTPPPPPPVTVVEKARTPRADKAARRLLDLAARPAR